ncbi:MAG: hypothetical protein ACE5IZ_03210 [Dehalococcoidia bacterium]
MTLRPWVLPLALAAALALTTATAAADGDGPGAAVHIIYFHAQDDPLDEGLLAAFRGGLEEVRRWYGQRLGTTFRRTNVEVVTGEKATVGYCAELPCQPSAQSQALFWAVVDELRQRGYMDGDAVYLVAVQTYEISSTMGQPGGPWYSDEGGGFATFGRGPLEMVAICDDGCRERRSALGTLAHELGHAFNLPHPESSVDPSGQVVCHGPCEETVMWNYASYPDVGFLDTPEYPETTALRQSPFFTVSVDTIALKAGWNQVSLPLAPEDAAAAAVLASLHPALGVAFAWDAAAGSWLSYDPHLGLSPLRLGTGAGFWLWLERDATLVVLGMPTDALALRLAPGWNLVGYPFTRPLPVIQALASIQGEYTAIHTWDAAQGRWLSYFPALGDGALQELRPGLGYWLYATQEATLTLEAPAAP